MKQGSGFAATVVDEGDDAAVFVSGDVDMSSSPILVAAIEEAARRNPKVVVDLADSPFIDSSGIGALLRACRQIGEGRLVVRAPTAQARRVFEMVGVSEAFEIAE